MFIILALVFLMGASAPASAVSSSALSAGSSSVGGLTTKDTARNLAKGLLHAATFVVVCAIGVLPVLALFPVRPWLYAEALDCRSQPITMVQFMERFPRLSAWVGKTTVQHVIEVVSKHHMYKDVHPVLKNVVSDLFVLPYKIAQKMTALWFDGVEVNPEDVMLSEPARVGSVEADIEQGQNAEVVLEAWLQHMPEHGLPSPVELLDAWSCQLNEGEQNSSDLSPNPPNSNIENLKAALVKLDGLFRTGRSDNPYHEGFTSFCAQRLRPVLSQLYTGNQALLLDVVTIASASLGDCHDPAAFFFMRIEGALAIHQRLNALKEMPADGKQQALQAVRRVQDSVLHEYHLECLNEGAQSILTGLETTLKATGAPIQKLDDLLEEFMVIYQVLSTLLERPNFDQAAGRSETMASVLSKAYRGAIVGKGTAGGLIAQLPKLLENLSGRANQSTGPVQAVQPSQNTLEVSLLAPLPHQKHSTYSVLLKPKVLNNASQKFNAQGDTTLIKPEFASVVIRVAQNWLDQATKENMTECLAKSHYWQEALTELERITGSQLYSYGKPEQDATVAELTILDRISAELPEFWKALEELPELVKEKLKAALQKGPTVDDDEQIDSTWLNHFVMECIMGHSGNKLMNTDEGLKDGEYKELSEVLQRGVVAASAKLFKHATQDHLDHYPALKKLDSLREWVSRA